jgi:hypothetical protein
MKKAAAKKLKCGCVIQEGKVVHECGKGKWEPPSTVAKKSKVQIIDECDPKLQARWAAGWKKYKCRTCGVKGRSEHKPGCTELKMAKANGMGPLDWALICRHLSGHKGEEVRCIRPLNPDGSHHDGLHQFPTSEAEREEQLNVANLQGLIDEAESKRSGMATKNVQSGKAAKAAPAKGKGNSAALAKAREVTDGKRAQFRAQKIKLLVKENPKRPGSSSFDRFALYKKSKTVGDFIEAGGKSADVAYDVKHEYIELV